MKPLKPLTVASEYLRSTPNLRVAKTKATPNGLWPTRAWKAKVLCPQGSKRERMRSLACTGTSKHALRFFHLTYHLEAKLLL